MMISLIGSLLTRFVSGVFSGLYSWIMTGKVSRKKNGYLQGSTSGMSLAEVLVSVAVTGVIASLAATTVIKNNSEDWGKQSQLMLNRIAAAAYSAQLKYGKSYLTATDSNGNLVYPNGMLSLLGSLDKSVKTTTSNGVTTFYYPGNMQISVGAIAGVGNGNNDGFSIASGTSQNQWFKLTFSNQDPTKDPTLSVVNGNAGYFILPSSSQAILTANQYSPSLYPNASFYDTYRVKNQPVLTAVNSVSPSTPASEQPSDVTPVSGGGGGNCSNSINVLALSSITVSAVSNVKLNSQSLSKISVKAMAVDDCISSSVILAPSAKLSLSKGF